MTSGGGYNVPLNIAMLNVTNPKKYNGTGAYGFHKRAQIVLNQYWRDKYGCARHHVLRDASGLGRHRRREAVAATIPQDPEVDPARRGIGRRHGIVARRHAACTARAGARVVRPRDPHRARLSSVRGSTKDTPQTLVAYLDSRTRASADRARLIGPEFLAA